MALTREEIESWATAYIKAEELPSDAKLDSPLAWAIERFICPAELTEAEDAWAAILEVLVQHPPSEVVGMLAAGPLEDLIENWGPTFIERVEIEARKNPVFRQLLGGVWKCGTPEVWQRVEIARGTI